MNNNYRKFWIEKENILPICGGRNAAVLLTALETEKQEKKGKQNFFENALRTYEGDDPLGLWYDYIRWVEQNFPTGGKVGNLGQILERCLVALRDVQKYRNDPRLCEVWIKYASTSAEPLEVYNYMYSSNICAENAQFYISWAWQLELIGNISAANEVLMEGCNRKVQPIESIQSVMRQFEMRFMRQYQNASHSASCADDWLEGRSAFNLLKPIGEACCIPICRTGENTLEADQPVLIVGAIQRRPRETAGHLPFSVYSAHQHIPILPVHSANHGNVYVLDSSCGKENAQKPTPWSKNNTRWQSAESARSRRNLNFTFHCDDTMTPSTSGKLNPDFGVLHLRTSEVTPPRALFEKPNPAKKAMYDKVKVLGGSEEFSFEEIHSAVWFENQRKLSRDSRFQVGCSAQEQMEFPFVNKACAGIRSDRFGVGNTEPTVHQCGTKCVQCNLHQDLSSEKKRYSARNTKATQIHHGTECVNCNLDRLNTNGFEENWVPNTDISNPPQIATSRAKCFATKPNLIPQKGGYQQDSDDADFPESSLQMHKLPFNTHRNSTPSEIPFCKTDAPLNVENNFNDDSENIPPTGYLPIKNTRWRSGILQPLLNFYSEENDMSEDDIELELRNNLTLTTPANTDQFACSAVSASTPVENQKSDTACDISEVGEIKQCFTPHRANNSVSNDLIAEASGSFQTPLHKAQEEFLSQFYNGSKNPSELSAIFETSREHRSKSTSTASSDRSSGMSCIKLPTESKNSENLSDFKCSYAMANRHSRSTDETFGSKSTKTNSGCLTYIDINPFDPEVRKSLLKRLQNPIESWNNFHGLEGSIKQIKCGTELFLRSGRFLVNRFLGKVDCMEAYVAIPIKILGKGNCPKVKSENVAIKLCESNNYWEFYICTELQRRLGNVTSYSVGNSTLKCFSAVSYDDGIALITEFGENGTLTDLINLFKMEGNSLPECLVMYLTFELLLIVSQMHECGILHCNITPHNVFVLQVPSYQDIEGNMWKKTICLQLSNFRDSIDLSFFKPGAAFKRTIQICANADSTCPWNYHVDCYGMANVIHHLLFSEPLRVKNKDGHLEPERKIEHHWQRDLWDPLFDLLLNHPISMKPPDIMTFVHLITEKLEGEKYNFKQQLIQLALLYNKIKPGRLACT